MEPISYRQFQEMFYSARRAWHLEMRDTYTVEQEEAPFSKWLNGEPDDFKWLDEWLSFMREITAGGVRVERLRVVNEPHTDYSRWSLTVAQLNVEAGEDVRYLPRENVQGIRLPEEDCWLFDDDRLVLSLFKPDGRSGGFAAEEDPAVVAHYRLVRDQAWSRAISYEEYVTR